MADENEGLSAWRQRSNHNRMMALQGAVQSGSGPTEPGKVEVAFFGHSAFRITSPRGISVMIDPWRNSPRGGSFFFHDFPLVAVDVGVSTHAHFDHDALHRLDVNVSIDRLIGTYAFADVRIIGIADKHSTDFSAWPYDLRKLLSTFDGVDVDPPDNPRSWDNCLIVVETGGLRFLHWGDNRADLSEEVWRALGRVDVVFLPVDDSQHVLPFAAVDAIMERLSPAVVVPSHYYIWNITTRQSTLLGADGWLSRQTGVEHVPAGLLTLDGKAAASPDRRICHFGDAVAFDVETWHRTSGAGF